MPKLRAVDDVETDGDQESYLAPLVPPGSIRPPSETAFANATWMHAGPEVRQIVERVLTYDEFSELAVLPCSVVWRRKSHPMRRDEPIFATVEITKPRDVWEASQRDDEGFPHFYVDLHWQHFNDLRNGLIPGEKDPGDDPQQRGAMYVNEGILEQHVHHALSSVYAENGILHPNKPDFSGYAMTVKRYGQWNEGIIVAARQLALWPSRDEG